MEIRETILVRVTTESKTGKIEVFTEDCQELKHAVRFVLLYQAKRNHKILKYEIENCPFLL